MKNEPAILAVEAVGGLTEASKLVGKDTSSVFRWRMPKEKGGANGRVPAGNFFAIWCAVITNGAPLTLEELVFTEAERNHIAELQASSSSESLPQSPRKSSEVTQ